MLSVKRIDAVLARFRVLHDGFINFLNLRSLAIVSLNRGESSKIVKLPDCRASFAACRLYRSFWWPLVGVARRCNICVWNNARRLLLGGAGSEGGLLRHGAHHHVEVLLAFGELLYIKLLLFVQFLLFIQHSGCWALLVLWFHGCWLPACQQHFILRTSKLETAAKVRKLLQFIIEVCVDVDFVIGREPRAFIPWNRRAPFQWWHFKAGSHGQVPLTVLSVEAAGLVRGLRSW